MPPDDLPDDTEYHRGWRDAVLEHRSVAIKQQSIIERVVAWFGALILTVVLTMLAAIGVGGLYRLLEWVW